MHGQHAQKPAMYLCVLIVFGLLCWPTAHAQSSGGLSGPSSVDGDLREDALIQKRMPATPMAIDPFKRWYEFKDNVKKRTGLQFGFDYSAFVQKVSESPGEDHAAGGIFRAFGTWTLFQRQGMSGALIYKFENRHQIGTEVSPIELGFIAGSALPTGVPFTDYIWGVTNLFWRQSFRSGRLNFVVGKLDATDYVDVYALINPWTSFQNLAFLTNPTIAVPDQGLGIAVGAAITDNIYVVGSLNDANGGPRNAGFKTFFERQEYFKSVEIGLTSSFERRYLDNMHLTYWHADARSAQGAPESWGLAFSATKFIGDKWLPFVRAGYAKGGASLLQASIGGGLGIRFENTDVFGIGLSWGRPFGANPQDQYTAEAFYRWQATDILAITPNFQLILDPSNNPSESSIAVFGVRARAAL